MRAGRPAINLQLSGAPGAPGGDDRPAVVTRGDYGGGENGAVTGWRE
jgi:hypothetical protein